MIDAAFVNAIAEKAVAASKVEIVAPAGMYGKVGIKVGAAMEWKDLPAPLRSHKIESLSDFCAVVKDPAIASKPEVYHTATTVSVVLDREQRREVVTMPLRHTSRFMALFALQKESDRSFSPAEAIKLIRYTLHGAGADALLAALRKVDFTRKGNGERTTEHGRESLGRNVEAAVQGPEKIPEEFVAKVPLWSNSGLKNVVVQVRVGVYIDMQNEEVELIPLADEIQNALDAAQGELHSRLATALGEGVPLFEGEIRLT